jgi:hypothetical protein
VAFSPSHGRTMPTQFGPRKRRLRGLGGLHHLPVQARAGRSSFLETGRKDDRVADTLIAALRDDARESSGPAWR